MVNPSRELPEMFPFDYDEQTVLALWIRVLWGDPFWGKIFQSVVFSAVETKSSFRRLDKSTEFLSFVPPPSATTLSPTFTSRASNKGCSGSTGWDRELGLAKECSALGCGVREDGSQAGEEERYESGMGVAGVAISGVSRGN